MNSLNLRKFWLLLFAICQMGAAVSLHAQIVYFYDASGNPTNSFLSASTGLSTSVSNSTQIVAFGGEISLDVSARGSGPITYQWRLNGVNIPNATNATYFISSATANNSGMYTVIVTGSSGPVTDTLGNVTVLPSTNALSAIAYGLSQYIAVGTIGTIVGSTNTVSWQTLTSGTSNQLNAIAFGGGIFVAVGANGTVLTSANEASWVVQNSGNTNNLNGVTYGQGIFVAVGVGGTTLTSPDGIHWTQQTYDVPTLQAVAFGNNLFLSVGTGGSIWTSSNGTNWGGQDWPTTNVLNSVAYGNGVFAAVGGSGLILSSPDGTNWAQETVATTESFTSILFFNSTFFGIGPIGQNFISENGINWGESSAGTFAQLLGSGGGSGIPLAVGENGTIVQIPYSLLDHFAWSTIPSPQRAGQSFSTVITAQDAANNTITSFNGSVTVSATTAQVWSTNSILGGVAPQYSAIGSPQTIGYAFTPNSDLLVTQLRSYGAAQQVSIWDEDGNLLASVNVLGVPNTWVSTPLPVPLSLSAGESYVVGSYMANASELVYYRGDGSNSFANGTIDQAFDIAGDAFPNYPESVFWFLVDLTYVVEGGQAMSVSPTAATLLNGVANVTETVASPGQGISLIAADNVGHTGASSPFDVYSSGDLTLTATASTSTIAVRSNLTYTITVMNAGPASATGVNVTNVLPANVTIVSVVSSQGSCAYSSGQVTCSVGTLGNQASAVITIVVAPTVSGVFITNTAIVTESGSDSNTSDNTATITTYVPPTLSIGNFSLVKPNTGTAIVILPITLSAPSDLAVQFTVATMNGTNSSPAMAGEDYVPVNGQFSIAPGLTTSYVLVQVQGNTLISPTKQFLVSLLNPSNATLANSVGIGTILNYNGLPGQVYNLVWGNIPSPQNTNTSFVGNITAQDAFGTTISNFYGPVRVTGINVNGPSTSTLLSNLNYEFSSDTSISTVGYQFTPTNDIYITHVRSFAGSKVSIWTATGFLLVSQAVTNAPGTWVETRLPTPVHLYSNTTYCVGAFNDGRRYYWCDDDAVAFADGQINQGYSSPGDSFPTNLDAAQWYLVDLRYVRGASMTPLSSGIFTNGVWAGNITSKEIGTSFLLMADDGNGHVGFSNPFGVYQTNDLALTLSFSPSVPVVGSNIIYTVTVLNPGPSASTSVFVTNYLPVGATFVSAVSSQGTCSQSGGVITCSLGTVNGQTNATVTITVSPTVAGLPLTDSATVTRNEPDPNLTDNSAVSVTIPSLALSLAISQATGYFWTPWQSGADALWSVETNITHDGISAAQSGSIIDSQQSWIEMTVRGPGLLTFWWQVSSQLGGDYLNFMTNGITVMNISGSVSWQQVNFSVQPGLTVLEWDYVKSDSISEGSDAGWLDQVSYTVPTFNFSAPAMATNGSFVFTVNGTSGQQLILQGSTNLTQWTSISTNIVLSGMINYTNTLTANFPAQFYRVAFMNQ